ncbi:MAG: hypothetical protein LBT26_03315 [Clostridiales Family XIII bacterium]|jgi:hypothetical protein|nr:hypothetical protein [Clostridiales Family XIII bacterium]
MELLLSSGERLPVLEELSSGGSEGEHDSAHSLRKINKQDVYNTVNAYFAKDRAKYLNKWILQRLQEVGLLW